MNKLICLILSVSVVSFSFGQKKVITLTLEECIGLATDSSLQAFRAKNQYISDYWAYRTYKASRLPSVSMQLTPVQYNSNITKRYDYQENIDRYRLLQSVSSSAGISVFQNFELTGGTFTLSSDLDYMQNFGENIYKQFSSIPVRLGYSQSMFGFNRFKWEKRIEPLKYEKAKQQYLYSRETISETAVNYFFSLAMAQAEYAMAVENLSSADSLYIAGKERYRISSISQADLLTLQLDLVNAENAMENVITHLQQSAYVFSSFFNLEKDCEIRPLLPEIPENIQIFAEEAIARMKANNPNILSYRQQVLESEQEMDRTRKESGFNASLSTSIGFNQTGEHLSDAYTGLLRQSIAGITLSIPLIDWGIRKGRLNMAKNNLDITRLTAKQSEQDLEQEVIATLSEFHKQQRLIDKTKEALKMAIASYTINKQRFVVGKSDLTSLTLSLNRKMEAQRNYLAALSNYWKSYYAIRKLTLHDFFRQRSLTFLFDVFENGNN
ncbi:MAG: TolC family protein [Dysgonamonadaceae bacterium]|jgi:outer membrane protein TolC|nr:TolC family protein [Dysgonamonadaceae bacterium]